MKILKFESFDVLGTFSPDKTFSDNVRDILADIQDDGFYVEIHDIDHNDILEVQGENIRIYIEKLDDTEEVNTVVTRDYLTKPYIINRTISDSIEHLLSYTIENGYTLTLEAISESQICTYEKFKEDKNNIDGVLLDIGKAPIDYIRIIISED